MTSPIPQNTHPILTQPLVHTTSQPITSVSYVSASTIHILASQNPPFTPSNTIFSHPSQKRPNPFTTNMPPVGSNTPSFIPPNIPINLFVTSQGILDLFPLGPWSVGMAQRPTLAPHSALY